MCPQVLPVVPRNGGSPAQALEALTAAVLQTERRKAAFGRGKRPEHYASQARTGGPSVVQVRRPSPTSLELLSPLGLC
jgi:hypothetical protein